MKKESFDATESELESLEKLIADASGYASQIHENKMKTIVNMLTIQQVMLDMNYDVNVIENPGKEDGYCIECTAGDECIKFDKVTVVDDGRPVIDIDHKESTTGTCAGTWEDIRKNLSEEGLFIEDIKKNGRSIHAANTGVSNKGVNNLSGKVLKN